MATMEYVLKHKEIPVMTFEMDNDSYKLLAINEVLCEERLPFGLKDKGNITQYSIQFNNWLVGRGLSESRKDLQQIKKQFKADSAKELLVKAYGLNLTDHYWFHGINENLSWKEMNYFDNAFDKILPGKSINPEIDESVNNQSPNLCIDGSIEKRWIIKEGKRVLLKGSMNKRMQEPFNEAIASGILKEGNIEHVHYDLKRTLDKNIPYSECVCMVTKDIEFINAHYIMNIVEYYRKDQYMHYLEICGMNGLNNVKKNVDEMIALDFLLGNVDRHKGNFGILRNSDTLQWLATAPVFDNGNCLFFDSENDDMDNWGIDTFGKAFGDSNRLNLQKIDKPDIFNFVNKKSIIDIVADMLQRNERLTSERINKVIGIVIDRHDLACKFFSSSNTKT